MSKWKLFFNTGASIGALITMIEAIKSITATHDMFYGMLYSTIVGMAMILATLVFWRGSIKDDTNTNVEQD